MAAEAIVSVIVKQLTTSFIKEIRKGVSPCADKAIQNLTGTFLDIQDLLMDAEEMQIKTNGYAAVRGWLDKLKEASYDIDDVLDEWNTKIMQLQTEQVGNASTLKEKVRLFFLFPGYCFRRGILSCEITFKIKDMNERLDCINEEKKNLFNLNTVHGRSVHKPREPVRITSSFVDVSDIYGRDEEKRTLVSLLLSESHEEGKGLHIISILGMGGIGKTTLAQFVYNDHEIVRNFEKRIWVCVSDPFDECRIAKVIIKALGGKPDDFIELDSDSLLTSVRESIIRKKFLLVLDDVWTEDSTRWNPLYNCLNNGLRGSKILVTTRKERVARMMRSVDVISIKELSGEICWSLFKSLALLDKSDEEREKLEEVGRKIVAKCKGLPLAIKTISSLLCFKETSDEWERILNSEVWDLEELNKDLFPILSLSYNDLPFMIKQCFSYCAIFPKDYLMGKDQLIQLWMAQSYLGSKEMEATGEGYFNTLVAYSFFQDFEKDDDNNIIRCKMHDILHDFAQSLTKNECFALEPISTSTLHAKARHSTVKFGKDASFPESILKAKRLRSSLLIDNGYYYNWDVEDNKLFDELTCLRALSLCYTSIEKISRKVGKLIHLRYLSLSDCIELKELPETLCDLYNLQTLYILNCSEIEKLPQEMGKLIHLRYLNLSQCEKLKELPETLCDLFNLQTLDIRECYNMKKLPQGMGKLINLRHLLNFGTCLLSMPKGMERLTCLRTLESFVVGREGSTVDCLKNLNNLRGSLEIRGLKNVTNIDEVKRAKVLHDKQYLKDLTLDFKVDNDESSMNERDEDILECLQPPSNLEKLEIQNYGGKTLFPNWMTLLIKLRVLRINDCINCDCLPPLGKLSSLEELYMSSMSKVEIVSNEFLGIENDPTRPSSSSIVAFPKLKRLVFSEMINFDCLPPLGKLSSLEELYISFMSNVEIVSNEFLGIENDPTRPSSSSIVAFPKLKRLVFSGMINWKKWDYKIPKREEEEEEKDDFPRIMPCLTSLKIHHCNQLKELPDFLFHITTLEELNISFSSILEDRCRKETGDYWKNIKHIKNIQIGFVIRGVEL